MIGPPFVYIWLLALFLCLVFKCAKLETWLWLIKCGGIHRWPWNTTLNRYCNYVCVYPRHRQQKHQQGQINLTDSLHGRFFWLSTRSLPCVHFVHGYVDSWVFWCFFFVALFLLPCFSVLLLWFLPLHDAMMSCDLWNLLTDLTAAGKQCCSYNVVILVSSVE